MRELRASTGRRWSLCSCRTSWCLDRGVTGRQRCAVKRAVPRGPRFPRSASTDRAGAAGSALVGIDVVLVLFGSPLRISIVGSIVLTLMVGGIMGATSRRR